MAKPVERFPPGDRGEPGTRRIGYATLGPRFQSCCQCVLKRVLGELKVAENADQRRQDRAGFGPKDPIERAGGRGHLMLSIVDTSITGRISIEPVNASGIRAAHSMA